MDASGARRGNRALAVGLLDALGAAGLGEARARALAAAGGDETALRTGRDELPAATVMAAFAAASPERTLCRSVGRSVLGPERQGLALLTGGVGGPEKAYRRIDQLLPKEDPTGAYRAAEIAGGGARVVYAPGEHGVTAAFCGVREGMLAAIPQLFGLPAGQVRESLCAARGAPHCVYEVRFARVPRAGLIAGGALGAAAGLLAAVGLGASLGGALAAALLAASLGAAAGRGLDLARQLSALAGARRAAPEILQAANGALAEKMDELAKLAARLDAAESHPSGLASGRGADAASQPLRRRSSLAAAVTRAVDSLRPGLPRDLELDVALQEEGTSIPCDAFQIEQMVLQLLRNAATAAGAGGRVGVTLRAAGEAAEIEIEDDGPGIDQEVVDRIFDPFEASQVAGAEQGFGLPVSYRIVQGHGGELRIESEPDRGTRVTAILPLR